LVSRCEGADLDEVVGEGGARTPVERPTITTVNTVGLQYGNTL
jgi:hypothetical protein